MGERCTMDGRSEPTTNLKYLCIFLYFEIESLYTVQENVGKGQEEKHRER